MGTFVEIHPESRDSENCSRLWAMPDLDPVREALRASMTAWATREVRGDQARVVPAPDPDRLTEHLDRLDADWSLGWACDQAGPYVVRARLSAAGVSREGLSTGPTLRDAKLAALAEAARFYGVGSTGEGHWVEYDPEEGANTADLEPALDAAPDLSRTALPPEPPRDPQMDKARQHIDELMDQIRAAGKGKEAQRLLMSGYGKTVAESREIYKELQAILRS